MKIVAVISCATDAVHTYMATEAIGKECREGEYVYKVGIQGALEIENKLSGEDIETADLIVFANDVGINKAKYFDAHKDKIIRHTPH